MLTCVKGKLTSTGDFYNSIHFGFRVGHGGGGGGANVGTSYNEVCEKALSKRNTFSENLVVSADRVNPLDSKFSAWS